jgi:exodeoxyribonuclease VII large subunit
MNLPLGSKVYSVSEITAEVKALLEEEFSSVAVEGEISNFTAAGSGHLYFVLKDKGAQIKCAFFRNKARYLKYKLGDGQQIVVYGSIGVYEPRGEYQLYVDSVEPRGAGELQKAFERLKAKLEAEGLFDPARKKPLPLLPRKIGVVTSPTGAVIRDIVRILGRRHQNLHILLYPAKVQGEGAAAEVAAGIRYLNTLPDIDVMIVGRGGGSIEDLWAFNEEEVARAIFASRIPVISAVGHETDFTIADFVADLRAPTPSAAAEMVILKKSEFVERLVNYEKQITRLLQFRLSRLRNRVLALSAEKAFAALEGRLRLWQQRMDEWELRLSNSSRMFLGTLRYRCQILQQRLTRFDPALQISSRRRDLDFRLDQFTRQINFLVKAKRARWENLTGRLNAMSPHAVLNRGYAICRDSGGKVIREAARVSVGDIFSVTVAAGSIDGRAESIYPGEKPAH